MQRPVTCGSPPAPKPAGVLTTRAFPSHPGSRRTEVHREAVLGPGHTPASPTAPLQFLQLFPDVGSAPPQMFQRQQRARMSPHRTCQMAQRNEVWVQPGEGPRLAGHPSRLRFPAVGTGAWLCGHFPSSSSAQGCPSSPTAFTCCPPDPSLPPKQCAR